ncbi:proton-conducting transporter membrane subunit [Natronoarchaeum sp. GCM10025321]|uniref:proton-conducting transporter transmembrane domain-containing protein n=1 Tax=Natronoarchaeum sp. GCM10025321 TaxID=3252684 RepID=UPI00362213C4
MSDATLAPIGLIVVPIIAAALSLAAGLVRARSGWMVALAALLVEAVLMIWLVDSVYRGSGRLVHELGAYGRPGPDGFAVGIELVADELSVLVVVLISVVSLGVLAISRRGGPRGNAFYSAYLLLAGGLMGVSLTGDLFNMFVFLEIVGLATYTLVAADRSAESAVAALKYLLIGTTGASLFLVGVGYLFLATGTLNMADLAAMLAGEPSFVEGALYGDTLVIAGFGFITAGLLVKSAIFPLHTWQPDAYSAAADSVTVYISALASTVAAYAFARVMLTVFTPAFFEVNTIAATAIVTLASISIVAGSALAVMQRRVKRMLAYSSVSQFGLIIAAIGIAVHPAAVDAGIPFAGIERTAAEFAVIGTAIHLVGHGLIKGGLFAAVGTIARTEGARTVAEYAELGRRAPVRSGAMAVLALALVGVPPTVGFLGKWYIALGAVGAGLWPLAVVIFASTVLTLAYVARLLERLYFTPRSVAVPERVAADGGTAATVEPISPTAGAVVVLVLAAIGAVALGFVGAEVTEALDPFIAEVFNS